MDHGSKVDASLVGIVVPIGVNLKAGLCEQSAMIFPAGVADQDFRMGEQFLKKI
jgi:hypothetical protein